MSEAHVYPVKENIKTHTHADNDTYLAMYQQSVTDPEGFWNEHGGEAHVPRTSRSIRALSWFATAPSTSVMSTPSGKVLMSMMGL